jgi:uncharacterized membrane protein YheB (UPF0754 family)
MFNKSLLTNLIAASGCAAGYFLAIDALLYMSMFALSGSLTNWLAVHMLFEKVPGLYGSGIVQLKFAEFKIAIKTLIMEQFFTSENLERFLTEQSGEAHHFDFAPLINDTDLSPAFNSLVQTIEQSSFGSMLGMFGGTDALKPLQQPFEENLKTSIIEISQTDEFAERLKKQLSGQTENSTESADAFTDIQSKVDQIVTQRLDELTPAMVKELVQGMIKSHLGWLVVWGGVFGGVIGLVGYILSI